MLIKNVIHSLELIAPVSLQESYDNAGLLTGDPSWECTGIICSLDVTEQVVQEAMEKNCNMIVAHHPIIFSGLKKINGKNYVERTIIKAIKNDIALYAIHTNLDNIIEGVNGRMADRLGLINRSSLMNKKSTLKKIFTFVPLAHTETVRQSIVNAGAGHIGNYSECSFQSEGHSHFKAGPGTHPFTGVPGELHQEEEVKLEMIFPYFLETTILNALKNAHPYEEVAYDIISLDNANQTIGSGLIGDLPEHVSESAFLDILKTSFGLEMIRHTAFTGRPIQKVALCGGAGSFLVANALANKADVFVSADFKYHEFMDADGSLLIADIGHYESEQYTIDLLQEILANKFPTFAVLKTGVRTNPVNYFS